MSASQYGTKVWEDYQRMLETGRFGAQVLGLWEPSRGSRQVDEWAPLLPPGWLPAMTTRSAP